MQHPSICSAMVLVGAVLAGMALPRAQAMGPVKMGSYDYDMNQVVLPPKLTAGELKGRELFVMRCAACHSDAANSYAPRLNQERAKAIGEEALRAKIAMGSQRMPGFRYMFDAPQVDLILAYVKSITPDSKP